ncbi:MAG: hypothetical protein Q9183_005817 [Haloplaca sp. 2 TL-2023]
MYALADKYGIPSLCNSAASNFKACLWHRNNPRELLFCVPMVYSSAPATDRTLRDMIVKYFQRLAPSINARPNTKARLMRLVHEIEQFREDVMVTLLEGFDGGYGPIVKANGRDVDSELEEEEDQGGMMEVF